jgi:hypothetical protein
LIRDLAGAAFGVSVSEQRSNQRSTSAESYTSQRGTNIQAGNIEITARETDINMTGAKLQARDISLDAKRDINLLAAQNTAATAVNSSGRSFGGGVTFGFGSQNGFSIARLREEGGQPLDVVFQAYAHPVCLESVFLELLIQGLSGLLRRRQRRVQAHPRIGKGFLPLRER